MEMKRYKPTSPGRRGMTSLDFSELSKNAPEKRLLQALPWKAGRNNEGRITSWHRGSRAKRKYRLIDFRRDKINIPAKVASIEYDPYRSANIAKLTYADGEKRYILAPLGLREGQTVIAADQAEVAPGNCLPLVSLPLGIAVHNLETRPGVGGKVVRSAGTAAYLLAREGDYAHVRLPSGAIQMFHIRCRATIGQVGNLDHENIRWGKAGRRRYLGYRSNVRGCAMNPIDHPHGGGEGKTCGGRNPVTPWGKCTRGMKTRKNSRTDRFILKRRKG